MDGETSEGRLLFDHDDDEIEDEHEIPLNMCFEN